MEDLIIAFAIIKNRNPKLWNEICKSQTDDFIEILTKKNHLYSYHSTQDRLFDYLNIPPLEMVKKSALFKHLEPINHYLNYKDHENKLNNTETIVSFSEDLIHEDIIRWVLPLYRSMLVVICYAKTDTEEYIKLKRLFKCLQILLISYCSKIENFRNKRFILETVLYKTVSSQLFQNIHKNSLTGIRQAIQKYLLNNDSAIKKFDTKRYFNYHFHMVASTVNILIQNLGRSETQVKKEDMEVIMGNISRICCLLESIVHLYIQLRKDKVIPPKLTIKSYYQIHLKRAKSISKMYQHSFQKGLTVSKITSRDQIRFLKIMIIQLISSISHIKWKKLVTYMVDDIKCTMMKYKYSILASVLVTKDYDMIALIRTCNFIDIL